MIASALQYMNLLVKLSVVPIFFLTLMVGWAGKQEESKVVEQPPTNATEPWQITVGGPGWLAGVSGTTGFSRRQLQRRCRGGANSPAYQLY
jgi:hypothetical protein